MTLPPVSRDESTDLRSLGTLALAWLTCDHPESAHVPGDIASVDPKAPRQPIAWCARCGAMGAGDAGQGRIWHPPGLAMLLERSQLRELLDVLCAVGLSHEALSGGQEGEAADQASPFARRERELALERARAALATATNSALYRDLERLGFDLQALDAARKEP